ncbi:uncharacterized protein [Nicotiana tomentosiformis]|uniref:uncharacterized protein n=1 Tax=Nicotiana tomentosiformis TaxID=4098 RepID=UPI00051B7784|nr:uncharacterized protein LOC104086736 [Nicotiana tomentosiformis]
MSLQLADQTTIIPEGIVEDVLVRVNKFVFHMDFIVVNMEENREVHLILGRPFLATGRAILDIQERQLILRMGEEMVLFKMEGAMSSLKERYGESKHDKFGVHPKKAAHTQSGRRNDALQDGRSNRGLKRARWRELG